MRDFAFLADGHDPKRAAILVAAFEAFLRHGFRRTSMEDIARGAGMSRAALYLHFRNKEDVFSQLTHAYFDRACAVLSQRLRHDGPLPEIMADAFATKAGPVMEAILSSPHGGEFADYKAGAGAAAMSAGDARLAAVIAEWLVEAQAAGRVVLDDTPEAISRVIVAALDGVYKSAESYAGYEAGIRALGRMFGKALEA